MIKRAQTCVKQTQKKHEKSQNENSSKFNSLLISRALIIILPIYWKHFLLQRFLKRVESTLRATWWW
jgi:hypothetical protein